MIPLLPDIPSPPTTPAAAGPGLGPMLPEVPGGEAGASDFAALLGAALPAARGQAPVAMAGAGPLPAAMIVLPEMSPDLAGDTRPTAAGLPGTTPSAEIEAATAAAPPRLPSGRNLPLPGASLPLLRLGGTGLPQALPGTALLAPTAPVTVPDGGPAASALSATDTVARVDPAPLASFRPARELAPPGMMEFPDAGVEEAEAAPRPDEPRAAPARTLPLTLARVSPEALPGEATIEAPESISGAAVAAASSHDDAETVSDRPDADPDSLAAAALPVALALPIPPLPLAAQTAPGTASGPAAPAPVSTAPVALAAAQPGAVPVRAAPDPVVMTPQLAAPADTSPPRSTEPQPSAQQVAAAPARDGSGASLVPPLPAMTSVPTLAQTSAAGSAPVAAAPRRVAPQELSAVPPQAGDPPQLAQLAAALPDTTSRDDPAASQPASASPPAPPLLAAASPPPAPADRPDPRAPALTPSAPQQQSTIDQVGTLREALRAQRPTMMLHHAEFGAVALRLEQGSGNEGLRAVLASRDPGFVPAIQAALAERVVAANTPASDSGASFGGQHAGTFHNGTGDHRSGSSPSGGQGSPQPYLGQSGSRDGEAAPDHRRPSTAAALAARVETEDGGSGGPASPAGGLFA